MSLTAQTQAVKNAISLLGTKIREISLKADNAPNAQLLEGQTLNDIVLLIAGTTGLTTQQVQDQLNTFVARTDNPHNVTAEQVGLGNVSNFSTATEAGAAGVNHRYIAANGQTAFSGADIDSQVLEMESSAVVYVERNANRVADVNYTVDVAGDTVTLVNPAVSNTYSFTATSGQTEISGADDASATLVIGNGQNVAVSKNAAPLTAGNDYTIDPATNSITLLTAATAGDDIDVTVSDVIDIRVVVADKFLTSQVVWHVMDSFWAQKVGSAPATLDTLQELAAALENNPDVVQDLVDQIASKATQADIDATVGALTKADIGLGSVEDFSLATTQEAVDGLVNNKYMTPALTKAHTDDVASGLQTQIDTKTAQTDHDALQTQVDNLNKADIGLGNVDNYGTANNTDATSGVATNLFMTPASTKAATDALKAVLEGQINLKASQADFDTLQQQVDAINSEVIGLDQVENHGIATTPEAVGTKYTYTATAGQTSFSGADNSSQALAFEADAALAVDVNGGAVDFTVDAATNTVTLLTGAAAGDVVVIRVATNDAYMTPARTLDVRKEITAEVTASLADIEQAFNDAIAAIEA